MPRAYATLPPTRRHSLIIRADWPPLCGREAEERDETPPARHTLRARSYTCLSAASSTSLAYTHDATLHRSCVGSAAPCRRPERLSLTRSSTIPAITCPTRTAHVWLALDPHDNSSFWVVIPCRARQRSPPFRAYAGAGTGVSTLQRAGHSRTHARRQALQRLPLLDTLVKVRAQPHLAWVQPAVHAP